MRRKLQIAAAVAAIVLLALLAVGMILLNGPPGQRWVRARVIERLQQMTGGRAELGRFRMRFMRLEVEAGALTIYGRSRGGSNAPAEQPAPWLQAEYLHARLNFFSLLRREIGLQSLVIERPVLRIVIYPDGSSNQPKPVGAASVGELFQLSIGHLELRDGALIVNERSLPLDLRAEKVHAQLASSGREEYRAAIDAENVTARYRSLLQIGAGTARLSIRPQETIINSATWSSGESRLQASGRLSNYSDPELQLEYKGQLSTEQLAKLSGSRHLRHGTVQVTGSAHYRQRRLDTRGKLVLRDAEWVSGGVRVRNLNAGAEYVIGPETALFPHLFASALGGSINGSLEVRNWRSENGSPPVQQGTAKLNVHGISLRSAMAAASSRQFPLEKLNLSGRASGAVDIKWLGRAETAVAQFDLAVVPPPKGDALVAGSTSELPVGGSVAGSYALAPARLHLDHLDLAGSSLQLILAGELGTTNANANLDLRSKRLSDLSSLLAVLLPNLPSLNGVGGEGSFAGTLTGPLNSPRVQGHINLAHLIVPARELEAGAPGSGSAAVNSFSFDSVATDVLLTPEELSLSNAVLDSGGSGISGNLRASLTDGQLNDASLLYGRITLRDTRLPELQRVAHLNYPVSGAASGVLQIGGTWAEPRAAGQVQVRNAEFYGERLQSLSAVVLLAGNELALDRITASFYGAQANGRAAYNWNSQTFRMSLQGSGLELARVQRIQSRRMFVSGRVQFDISGNGTLSQPSLGGKIDLQSIALNGERLGALHLEGVTRGRTLHIEAGSRLSRGTLSLQGDVELQNDFPAKAELKFSQFDVGMLLAPVLRDNLNGHSSADGVLQLEGPLRRPSLLVANGKVDQVSTQVRGVELSNRGPIEFTVERRVLRLRQFHLAGDGTDLTATGTAELAGSHRLQLQAKGNADLRLLKAFNPNLESSGSTSLQVDVAGTVSNPDMRGTALVQDGSVSYQDLPNGLSDLNGTLLFNEDRLEVQSLTGRSGGGEVTLGGFVNIGPRMAVNLTMKGQGVRLRHPPGISSLMNLDLRLTGSADRYTLSGNVLLTRFGITPQFDLGYYIAGLKRPQPPDPLSPLNRLQLNLQVTSAPELQLETSAARLTGDVDFNVRGTAAHPVLIGDVNGTEGEVVFEGARYQVNHAEISFNNPVRVEPVFDAELVTRIREYEVTLNFYGPLDRLNTTYRSEPPLPTADIVGLLAFGHTRPETVQVTRPSASLTQSESQAILEQAMNSALNDRVQKLFGVSRLRISPPEAIGTQINPSARLTLERQVSRNMTVIYVTNVSQSSQQVIQMEYNVSPSVALVATRDQNGIVSFDVRIRQRKR